MGLHQNIGFECNLVFMLFIEKFGKIHHVFEYIYECVCLEVFFFFSIYIEF